MGKHYWQEALPRVLELEAQAYFALTRDYGITPSMSKRGTCYDNAVAENFFGILKAECLRRHKPKTVQEAQSLIDNFIFFYNNERIGLCRGCIFPPGKGGNPSPDAAPRRCPQCIIFKLLRQTGATARLSGAR